MKFELPGISTTTVLFARVRPVPDDRLAAPQARSDKKRSRELSTARLQAEASDAETCVEECQSAYLTSQSSVLGVF